MEKLEKYINELFQDAPKTKKVRELKDELTCDLEEKYKDLIKDGKSEQVAYREVISGIGDIEELLSTLSQETVSKKQINTQEIRKKNALVVSICVALYILMFIAIVVLDELVGAPDYLIATVLFGGGGIPTCILIYHFMSIPKYEKEEEIFVEEYREHHHLTHRNREIRNSISSILWILTTIIYFLISFQFGAWNISWIIFIIAALIEEMISLAFKIKGENHE